MATGKVKLLEHNYNKCKNCAYFEANEDGMGFKCKRHKRPYACDCFYHKRKNKFDLITRELIEQQDAESRKVTKLGDKYKLIIALLSAVFAFLNVACNLLTLIKLYLQG